MRYFLNIMFTLTEEQEESAYNLYISEVRNLRLRLESCEDRLIRQIRTPLERDDVHESVFRISEQEVRLRTRGPRSAHVGSRRPSPLTLQPLTRSLPGPPCELWLHSWLMADGDLWFSSASHPVNVEHCVLAVYREAAGPLCRALGDDKPWTRCFGPRAVQWGKDWR